MDAIKEFIETGGPFMYVNMVVTLATVAIVLERVYRLYIEYNISGHSFLEQIEKLIIAGSIDKAVKQCALYPSKILPTVLKAGLLAAHKGRGAISAGIEESLIAKTPLIQKRVQTLWALANIATLIGLVGTITGLIGAFKAVGLATPEQKTMLLTKGISEAMYNTAFGLGIAVSCIVAHLFINGQAKKLIEELELSALRIENILTSRPMNIDDDEQR